MAHDRDRYFAVRRQPGRTYVSGRFDDDRRIASRVYDTPRDAGFEYRKSRSVFVPDNGEESFEVKGEAVLREFGGVHRYQLKALFLESTRHVRQVVIQKFTKGSGKPHDGHLSLTLDELRSLNKLVDAVAVIELADGERMRVDDAGLNSALADEKQRLRLLREHPALAAQLTRAAAGELDVGELVRLLQDSGRLGDVLQRIAEAGLEGAEVIAVAQRKQALRQFQALLHDPDHFDATQLSWRCRGPEALWQRFFEENNWILGYGLRYQFGVPARLGRLEQNVAGHSVGGEGRRVDALLATLGHVRSLCYVEVKRHDTPLLARSAYRGGVYAPSTELVGAVAQAQATVQAAIENYLSALPSRDPEGALTGELLYNYMPKALVLCGTLAEFAPDGRVHPEQFRSFELFRRGVVNPEILTFDELYERARHIVEEGAAPSTDVEIER
ncbi:MAG: DUF4263 domain-containing protein [Myxococcales bacterium]|nr:DUF4263 domain-containing protein [Myxococcales bacterium]